MKCLDGIKLIDESIHFEYKKKIHRANFKEIEENREKEKGGRCYGQI